MQIVLGSKEYLIVDLVDNTGSTSSLAGLGAQFEVWDVVAAAKRQGPTACVVSGMRAQSLVDSSIAGFVAGTHRLYILLTSAGLENPKIFAGDFEIISL